MGLIAAIQRQSRRSYHVAQGLLVGSVAATSFTVWTPAAGTPVDWWAASSTAAITGAMFTLHHARRGLRRKLDRLKTEEQMRQHLLQTDAITGVMTRRHFLDQLQQALKRNGEQTALMLTDIDHFKQLNDTFGHASGDAALAHAAACLVRHFPDGKVGRLGGDELAVLLTDCDLNICEERARGLVAMMSHPFRQGGVDIPLSVSVGLALSQDRRHDVTSLFQNADLALYAAKAAGRGRAVSFDDVMLSELRQIRYLERELRAAIRLGHLELHYQPLVDACRNYRAFEGLVRWRHPVRGLIPPGEFIPVAEKSTLIDHLGEWVFRRACADFDRLGGCRISINVSGEQLKRDSFVAMTEKVLAECERAAESFVLEITETVATDATPDVLARLHRLRAMGFRIALDDFGTGYCGFNYLKTLPVDAIKIDRSYISDLGHDRVAQVLVSALTEVGRLRDISVVAEGVETEEDFRLSRAAGCDRFQGYHISRPEPLHRLDRTLLRQVG